MRTLNRSLVPLVVMAALGSCGFAPHNSHTSSRSPLDSTCTRVRAGIADFNDGNYEDTIKRFTDAKKFARAYASQSDSPKADDLLKAVVYYAELPADQYAEAARTSKDFAKYKAITLGQCESGGDGTLT